MLATQRAHWDFREAPLSPNGRSALLFITDNNDAIRSINLAQNDVGIDEFQGISHMVATCSALQQLDLSDNLIGNAGNLFIVIYDNPPPPHPPSLPGVLRRSTHSCVPSRCSLTLQSLRPLRPVPEPPSSLMIFHTYAKRRLVH